MKDLFAGARSVAELVDWVAGGSHPEYVFFWKHEPRAKGTVDQSCLSNWFPAPFIVDGTRYPTTEHYMMAEKARLFGDDDTAMKILATESPAAAKDLGRQVSGFQEEFWVDHRFDIVVSGNLQKFSQNPALGDFLRGTGSSVLVEASPYDPIWGIGLGEDDTDARCPSSWRGQNLLGFALMEVRHRLFEKSTGK